VDGVGANDASVHSRALLPFPRSLIDNY
jgi:hypothetical protein